MKKLIALALALLLFSAAGTGLSAGEPEPAKAQYKKVPPVALEIINSSPAASGQTMFELAAAQANRWVDEHYARLPKSERPYFSSRTLARAADSLVKSYRAGDRLILTEIATRIPYDLTVDQKVDLLEKVTRAYLEAEARKK